MTMLPEIEQRYSCRSYRDQPIEPEKLTRVLEAARLAPSARNFQEWRFIVVTDPDLRQQMVDVCKGQAFVGQAPAIVVACGVNTQHVMSCGQRSTPIDVAIALEHVALQATREGLATCWIGAFLQDQAKALLGVPDDAEVVECMPIGYPADARRPKTRVGLDEIVYRDRWGQRG